jgi:DNA-binding NarL/FixJ family response regulator
MSPHDSIRVQIVHSDSVASAGLIGSLRLLSDFLVREGTCRPGQEPPLAESDDDEVVIADLRCAMELARCAPAGWSRRRGRPPIVVVSGPDRERELKQALECQIQGYLVSGFSIDELAQGVRAVHRGARYLCPRAASKLAESVHFSPLTEREEAVLELLAQGLCNKDIARQLDIAVGTVKSHLKSAYGKLFVGSRTQAVVVSERRGLLARQMNLDEPTRRSVLGFS